MAWVQRYVAQCDQCGHEWLPKDPETFGDPRQCAKCRRWSWNRGKFIVSTPIVSKPAAKAISSHNLKTCRVYRCAQCVALGKKF